MDNQLFATFEPVGVQAWKQIIQADLKGADYNETLVWESLEGIKVKPIYHADNAEYLNIPPKENRFKNAELIEVKDEQDSNVAAKEALKNGIHVVIFKSDKTFDCKALLKDLPEDKAEGFIFDLDFIDPDFIKELSQYPFTKPFSVWVDPIAELFKTGMKNPYNQDLKAALDIVKANANVKLTVEPAIFQNAGANIVQQIAYTLSYLMEYINRDEENVLTSIPVKFAIGNNYFFEIAKFRAFRYLWDALKKEVKTDVNLELIAVPGLRNKTLRDYHNNILRTGTELMSAVLGGADLLVGLRYDILFKDKNPVSSRTARNQLNILNEEVTMADVDAITKGTYYIEELTIELAKKSLELFQMIEDNDGLLELFYREKLQEKIKQSADKEQALYDEGKIVLVGSNKYEQKDEKVPEAIQHKRREKTDYEPIPVRFLAF